MERNSGSRKTRRSANKNTVKPKRADRRLQEETNILDSLLTSVPKVFDDFLLDIESRYGSSEEKGKCTTKRSKPGVARTKCRSNSCSTATDGQLAEEVPFDEPLPTKSILEHNYEHSLSRGLQKMTSPTGVDSFPSSSSVSSEELGSIVNKSIKILEDAGVINKSEVECTNTTKIKRNTFERVEPLGHKSKHKNIWNTLKWNCLGENAPTEQSYFTNDEDACTQQSYYTNDEDETTQKSYYSNDQDTATLQSSFTRDEDASTLQSFYSNDEETATLQSSFTRDEDTSTVHSSFSTRSVFKFYENL